MTNIYSNDIHAGLVTYGVEMARAAVLKEIQGVFGAYKIEIDGRHLELIADYMVSYQRLYSLPTSLTEPHADIRWWLQAVQPKRYFDEFVATA
jgi:hypothetical protein